jgi:hypothetical protein
MIDCTTFPDGQALICTNLQFFGTTCTTAQIARSGKYIILKEVRFGAVFTQPV